MLPLGPRGTCRRWFEPFMIGLILFNAVLIGLALDHIAHLESAIAHLDERTDAVFAASVSDPDTGYALTSQQVAEAAATGLRTTREVSSGDCA